MNTSNNSEPLTQTADSISANKRPVSMYEPREGLHTIKPQQTDNRTANSMYQMIDGQLATNSNTNGISLPCSDDVKQQTEIVTRRIQELWQVMQEQSSKDAFVPGAERIRIAVTELTSLFPTVSFIHFHFRRFKKKNKKIFFFSSNSQMKQSKMPFGN